MQRYCAFARLCTDIEQRFTADGKISITRFNIAVNNGKAKDGTDKPTTFLKCIAFNGRGDLIAKSFEKGARIYVEGELMPDEYVTKDGKTVKGFELHLTGFEYIDPKKKDESSTNISDFFPE